MREVTPSKIPVVNSFWLLRHKGFTIPIMLFYILGIYLILETPKGWEITRLETNFVLFGPSIVSFILLIYIGSYLVYRYYLNPISKSESLYQLSWGISFLIYAILFLGLCLQAFSIDFADMRDPKIFFFWRFPMIIWVSGMWVGTALLYSEHTHRIYLGGISINVLGGLWFIYGLLIKEDISLTMYVFLYMLFVPLCLLISYFWWQYANETKLNSPKLLALGFLTMGLSYAGWAPWHFPELIYIYFIFFQFFTLSLAFIFAGFYGLPKEITIKYSR